MKRDLDKVREILLKSEGQASKWTDLKFYWPNPQGPESILDTTWSELELYQITLLQDAEYVVVRETYDSEQLGYISGYEFRLTNAGHDYLDSIRDAGIWSDTKKAVAEQGGSVALELVKSLALAFGRKQLEDRTGLKL